MRKLVLLFYALALALALGPPLWAQQNGQSITTTSTTCASIDGSRMSTVGIQITGTWTGTLTPEISVQGANSPQTIQVTPAGSSTAQTSITANGYYYASGGGVIYVCGPTSTGTAVVYFQPVPGTARSSGGGSGAVSNCSAAGLAYYALAGSTVVCDLNITDNGSGVLANAAASLNASGVEVGSGDAFIFSSTTSPTGAQALDISPRVANANTFSFDTTGLHNEAALLRWNTCKIASAITLSTSATTICSWSLTAAALTWSWQCQGTYSITAGTSPTLALGMNPTQPPSVMTGNGIIYSAQTTAPTWGSASSTSSGNTNFDTGAAVSPTLTNIPWQSSGTVTWNAGASGAFQITATLGGTTPAGTIAVGSTCMLY